jgi:hypothetical protein
MWGEATLARDGFVVKVQREPAARTDRVRWVGWVRRI